MNSNEHHEQELDDELANFVDDMLAGKHPEVTQNDVNLAELQETVQQLHQTPTRQRGRFLGLLMSGRKEHFAPGELW